MGKLSGNRVLIIGVLALATLCGGGVFLAVLMPVGALALRLSAAVTDPVMRMAESTLTAEASNLATLSVVQILSPTNRFSETPSPEPGQWQEGTISATYAQPAITATMDQKAASLTPKPTMPPYLMQPTSGPSPTMRPVILDDWCVPWNSTAVRATVLKVLDGVSAAVSVDGKNYEVRYIGIDMLDYSGDWTIWARSTAKNRELVEGKSLLLIKGLADTDDEGRWLRYVIVDGRFVNQELLRAGFAVAQAEPIDPNCALSFQAAQAEAVQAKRGLWSATPTPTRTLQPASATAPSTGQLMIVNVAYRGTIWQEPEEYVEVTNSGILPIQLEGWSVSDIENHIFVFPRFVLGQGQYCRVYTNLYRPTECGFSYFRPSPVWDNTGDCATLRDATGRLVDEFCYP